MSHPDRPSAGENLIAEAQQILGRYLEPGNGMTERDCINQLLAVLDGPVAVLLREEASVQRSTRPLHRC